MLLSVLFCKVQRVGQITVHRRFAAFKQIQQWNTGNDGMYGPGESTRAKETTAAIEETTKSTKKAKTAYEQLSDQL